MEKEIREKKYIKINVKPPIKLLREVKKMVLIVGGGWISDFAVEGGKSDFCDS